MEFIDILNIQRDGLEPGTGSPIPATKWFKRNDDQKKWLADNANNQRHQELEREYQERKKQDYHY
jgi:hypothetical protein